MRNRILGIVVICFLLIAGVYAFGPHTRFTNLNEQCIYYHGPWSCRVQNWYCTPDGKDYHIILDKSMCLDNYIELGKPSAVPLVEEPLAEEPQAEPVAAEQQAPARISRSYLGILIGSIVLFCILIIGWILFYETWKKLRLAKGIRCVTVCPRCGTPMKTTGALKQGPRGGLRQTYVCPKCGHRTMTTKGRKETKT
jgi:hypothetical protein